VYLHHDPQWNTWALDRDKNGGPFMDAMVHNLNIARYLMGRPMTACTFFSDSHAHQLPCADTEAMKCDFADNGATLFDAFAAAVQAGAPLRRDIVAPQEAAADITLLRMAEQHVGQRLPLRT
jgi:hypothetical protein